MGVGAADVPGAFGSTGVFVVRDGRNPSLGCLGTLEVGTEVPVVRRAITSGTCTPILYEFPDDLVALCEGDCFAGG